MNGRGRKTVKSSTSRRLWMPVLSAGHGLSRTVLSLKGNNVVGGIQELVLQPDKLQLRDCRDNLVEGKNRESFGGGRLRKRRLFH
ncbi:hypothetical protein NL676_002186 [Syzygium grande]|nr:hypothetical protein NL676_002186 [Syzygium grande]